MNHIAFIIFAIVLIIIVLYLLNGTRYIRVTICRADEDLLPYGVQYASKPRVQCKTLVTISLTTTPQRITGINYTLKSLLDQSFRVDKIYLVLPLKSRKGQEYTIPEIIYRLAEVCPQFEILRVHDDLGPITKIAPILKLVPASARCIYVDDDYIYGSGMVEEMIKVSESNPEVALCMKGLELSQKPGRDPREVQVLQGYGGVLVRPQFFDLNKLLQYDPEVAQPALLEDDFWISGLLAQRGIRR